MSESDASDRTLEGLDSPDVNENGGVAMTEGEKDGTAAEGSTDPEVSLSNGDSERSLENKHLPTEEESSSSIDVKSAKLGDYGENGSTEVEVQQITEVEMPVSVDQVDEHAGHEDGGLVYIDRSIHDHPVEENVYEDVSREESFEDAADELTVDGRISDGEVLEATAESQESLGKNLDIQVVQDRELQVGQLMDELALARAQLERTVAEKENMARECVEYKGEREVLARGLANLHHELQMLSDQCSLQTENREELIDYLRRTEKGDSWGKTFVSDMPLDAVIDDCSKFTSSLKSALDEQLQSEGTVRELHAILFIKDQEIEDLGARVSELSVSCDVYVSYMDSLQKALKDSFHARHKGDMHLEDITNKLLASLSSVVRQDDVSEYSVNEKISLVENSTAFLIGNYMKFLSEINNLGHCLSGLYSDFSMPEDKEFDVVLGIACEKLLECKRNEVDLLEKVNKMEEENAKLLAELEKTKGSLDEANIVSSKTKTDLEQAETKLAAAREKLSMAVTKGKALVQQRDSLRQSLNEKTNELEKCLLELQQKASALEAAEDSALKLVESQQLVVSLQESLLQRTMALQQIEEAIFQVNSHEEIQYMETIDKVRWLVDQKNILENVLLESSKLKAALSPIDLPETVSSTELDFQIDWLVKSFAQAKDDTLKLQEELFSTREAVASHESKLSEAREEIAQLTASLLGEQQEKDSLQTRLEDLTYKYEGVVEKASLVSSERNELMKMVLELSGSTMEDQEIDDKPSSDTGILMEKCIEKIRERIGASSKSSFLETEMFQRIQSLLYMRDQDLMLCEKILEEVMVDKSELLTLSNELRRTSEEVVGLKNERDALRKDLGQAEEKSSLIREKLSMAVKKGKGLVQEREGLKLSLNEKNAEIKKLKHNLGQQESLVLECEDRIQSLSSDLERISKLESDASAMKGERDQLEQFLLESNSMLQKVMGSMEEIVVPTVMDFKDPVEKMQCLAKHIQELQVGKTVLEQELEKSKEEAALLDSKSSQLTDAYATIKHLEDALSQAEKHITVLSDEMKAVEAGKSEAVQELEKGKEEAVLLASKLTLLEQELEKSKEEAALMGSKMVQLADAHATIKYLEDALSQAEKHITGLGDEKKDAEAGMSQAVQELEKATEAAIFQASKLTDAHETIRSLEDVLSESEKHISILDAEKKDALVEKTRMEQELEKVKEESGFHFGKLTDAYVTIKSLEDALSHAEKSISMLGDETKDVNIGRASLEKELEKVQEETGSLASKLADALTTTKSLEDALSHAENNISVLSDEKREAETRSQEEITTLNTKLAACVEELTRTQGRLENQSSQLVSHFNHLLMFMKDEGLHALLTQQFKKKFEGLRKMALLLQNIRDQFAEKGSEWLQLHHDIENDPRIETLLSFPQFEDYPDDRMVECETSATDIVDSIPSYFTKIIEGLKMQNKLVSDKLEDFSSSMDKDIAVLSEVLQTTSDEIIHMFELTSSLKLNVDNLEASNQALENKISTLQNNMTVLVSAFTDATQELQIAVHSGILGPSSRPELATSNCSLYPKSGEVDGSAVEDQCEKLDSDNPVEAAESLLLAAGRVRDQLEQFQSRKSAWLATIEELQNEVKETKLHAENAIRDRDFNLNKASNLADNPEALENFCNEMKLKLEDYQNNANKLREKEEEIPSLYRTLADKDQVAGQYFLTEGQLESLFSKVSEIDISFEESPGPQHSGPVSKLFYIVNKFSELQHGMDSLICDKEELQLSIEHLKKQAAEISISSNHDLDEKNSDFVELTLGLEKIIKKLGRNDLVEDDRSAHELLPLLEKMVLALIMECESHKSKAQELGSKLHGNQKVVDELSVKVRFLEDSLQERPAVLDAVQENSTSSSLVGASEISEIEDVGPVGKSLLPPIPAAAHVRTMWKGSSDHLALNIDSESDRLINHRETDDKGHVFKFKALSTSGLVPKQGKLIADRIDGIWVSGGRIFMSRPGARIGLFAYCLLLHIWVLGTIL
ncbi:myosin-11 [Cinnamomum micranthum f. kanehirae]|uniref:Myosin-11 n=1 Tax=Cinnamomum micranthum f. kanehirae TaxID=337451 RepID=A0A443N0P3_9MAGN|nr:myosin-11 [Cinnamomum micranthum f. kanehirae]